MQLQDFKPGTTTLWTSARLHVEHDDETGSTEILVTHGDSLPQETFSLRTDSQRIMLAVALIQPIVARHIDNLINGGPSNTEKLRAANTVIDALVKLYDADHSEPVINFNIQPIPSSV